MSITSQTIARATGAGVTCIGIAAYLITVMCLPTVTFTYNHNLLIIAVDNTIIPSYSSICGVVVTIIEAAK